MPKMTRVKLSDEAYRFISEVAERRASTIQEVLRLAVEDFKLAEAKRRRGYMAGTDALEYVPRSRSSSRAQDDEPAIPTPAQLQKQMRREIESVVLQVEKLGNSGNIDALNEYLGQLGVIGPEWTDEQNNLNAHRMALTASGGGLCFTHYIYHPLPDNPESKTVSCRYPWNYDFFSFLRKELEEKLRPRYGLLPAPSSPASFTPVLPPTITPIENNNQNVDP